MAEVFAFEVRHRHAPAGMARIINARSRGQAVAEYLSDIRDCWPDVQYTDLRAHKLGAPYTSDAFKRNAAYRGMPDVRCGQRVRACGALGVIVGHNDCANFDVLFDDDTRFKGLTLNVHPSDIELVHEEPRQLVEF